MCARKLVVAHFMVGNAYPYTVEDWLDDIRLASSHGIDGFALNFGRDEWEKSRVADCYHAALQSGVPFKLFPSFDMTLIPANCSDDVQSFCDYVTRYRGHPNQLLHHGKVFISTFAGESNLFGHTDLNHAWKFVKSTLEEIAPVHFVPSFFIDPARYPHITAMDGYFNWNGSWPLHLHPGSPREEVKCPRLDTDRHHIHHLGGRTFMAAVSPWFFTHYGPDSWNKNWIRRGDDWLYVRRWEQLIAMRDEIDIVQIISWNDYGESHYIGPIKGAQPNSQAWVDGFPHEPWLHLTRYYADAFKNGHYSAIEKDQIYMWSRPHLKDADATEDTLPRPENWQLTDDEFWVVIFSTAPGLVVLTSTDEQVPQTVEVAGGVTKLSSKMVPGGSMKAQLFRSRVLAAECTPERDGFRFQTQPRVFNFNAYVAMSV
ncbi:glycoside hydrolase family 71 protein [Sparassis latifolia]